MIIKNLVRLKEVGAITTKCYSLEFDGVAEYINCTNNVAFDLERTDSFSISVWVKLSAYDALISPMVSKWDLGVNRGYQFRVESTGKIGFLLYGSFPVPSSSLFVRTTTDTIPLDTWVNVTLTYGGTSDISGCNIYINGILKPIELISTGSTLTTTTINTENLYIGYLLTYYFNGKIASARVWSIELSVAEVLAEYNNKNNPASIQTGALVINTDINNSIFNGSEWDIPDLTGITAGYQTVLMEVGDRVLDCPT